jgi:hypothetical protein
MLDYLRKTFVSYSDKNDDPLVQEFIDYYGQENIPNPDQYPLRFAFLVKSFQHHKKMQEYKVPQKGLK